MRRFFVPSVVLAALAIEAACSSKAAAPAPVAASTGAFRVTVQRDTTRLVVSAAGTLLLEGLDVSDDVVTPQSRNDDAPPMTGFAVRALTLVVRL